MGGLIFSAVIGVWVFIVSSLITWLAKKLPRRWWKTPLTGVLLVCVLVLPIVDEIVGGWQFKRLCKANSDIYFDKETAVGRAVYSDRQPYIKVKGTWVTITLQKRYYLDAKTNESVISFSTVHAKGGWLKHTLPFTQQPVPLLFSGGCGPNENLRTLFKSLKITVLD